MRPPKIKIKGKGKEKVKIKIKPKEYLMWVLLWHTWSAKKLYENVHHTKSTTWSETKKVVDEEMKNMFDPKYNFKTFI
jgi:hypothetical protein